MTPTTLIVLVTTMIIAVWLYCGVKAFGMSFAYVQRRYPDKQIDDLWHDFFTLLPSVFWGPFFLVQLTNFMKERDAWNYDYNCPVFGYKFLPRHEYRYE